MITHVSYKGKEYKIKKAFDGRPLLEIFNKNVTDITEIIGLDQAKYLDYLILADNRIEVINGLEKLINLSRLSLKGNLITEISGLDKLKNLEQLNLNYNLITDISGLKKLSNLKILKLKGNCIKELKGLEQLKKLKYLNLSENPVELMARTHVGPLENLAQSAVAYCSRMVGAPSHSENELKRYLEKKSSEAFNLASSGDILSLLSLIKKVYNKINVNARDISKFCQFFGEIITKFPSLYDLEFSEMYEQAIRRLLTTQQALYIEKTVLENNCFYRGEEFLAYFKGSVYHQPLTIYGRIYITNYRVIYFGNISSDNDEYWGRSLLFDIVDAISSRLQKHRIEKLSKALNIPRYGLQFPIDGVDKIWFSPSACGFESSVPYKGSVKQMTIRIDPQDYFLDIRKKKYVQKYEILEVVRDLLYTIKGGLEEQSG